MESRYPTTGRILALIDGEVKKLEEKVAQHYEPKLQFSSTPVYSVTLAEDVDLNSGDYTIDVSAAESENFIVDIEVSLYTTTQSANCTFYRSNASAGMIAIANITSNSAARLSLVRYRFVNGALELDLTGATQGAKQGNVMNRANVFGVYSDPSNPITAITLSGSAVLPAGMAITVYAAKEV